MLSSLTLTIHSPTKSNKGKWRKCGKSDYVIERGLIWERNHCPGSDSQVACRRWTVHCGAGGPQFKRGEPCIFWTLPFQGDNLETKKGRWELGLKQNVARLCFLFLFFSWSFHFAVLKLNIYFLLLLQSCFAVYKIRFEILCNYIKSKH